MEKLNALHRGFYPNFCSIWEAFSMVEAITGKKQVYTHLAQNRIGDHICYYSYLLKMRAHYAAWEITISLSQTIEQVVRAHQQPQ